MAAPATMPASSLSNQKQSEVIRSIRSNQKQSLTMPPSSMSSVQTICSAVLPVPAAMSPYLHECARYDALRACGRELWKGGRGREAVE